MFDQQDERSAANQGYSSQQKPRQPLENSSRVFDGLYIPLLGFQPGVGIPPQAVDVSSEVLEVSGYIPLLSFQVVLSPGHAGQEVLDIVL